MAGAKKRQPLFLVADGDRTRAKRLSTMLRGFGRVRVTSRQTDAVEELRRNGAWSGFVIGEHLEEGSGDTLLAYVRTVCPSTEALAIGSGHFATRAYQLHAHYVSIREAPRVIRQFAEESTRPGARLGRVARRFNLSEAETRCLELHVRGLSRKQIAEERGVSENTVKTQTRSICRKTGKSSLEELACDEGLRWSTR